MSRLGPALRSQFMKGVKDVLKTTAKETMKSAAEEMMTARPRVSSVGSVSIPSSISLSPLPSPSPQQQQFPALCVCKYEANAPDFENGQKQYICSSCSKTGLRDYKTIVEGRSFAGLKGGVGGQTKKRSRLHLTKRMRRRHNGRSRR
jgi:hypothetical protein